MTRIGSIFSGYSGLDMAVTAALAGGRVVWHSDIKPASVALLAHRHPEVPNLGDMTAIDYAAAPPIDVLAASWPCQPHSAAGKRLGEKDPRALWPNVARAIEATRPKIFFGENVARIAGNGELRRVARSLADLGYVGAWRCIRASDVGACHRRERCFVVAIDPASYATRVGRAEGWARDARQLGRPHAALGGDGLPRLTLLPTPSASSYGTNQGGAAGRVGPVRESLDTMAKRGRFDRWGIYGPAIARHEQALGRPAPEPTQISPRTGRPQLAPRFVEFLMMLPDGWVTDVPGLTRNQQLSLLGDGVCPPQGAAAFTFLLDHLARRLAEGVAA